MSIQALPAKDSSEISLDVATPEEVEQTYQHNSAEWMGPLAYEAYLRREQHLVGQDLTKNGGLTSWVLVHQPESKGPRKILCACETIKKRAFVAVGGKIDEVICHGVASVFCPAENRGKGYAARMISDLSDKIEHWQNEDRRVLFSILYSDIGKVFYTTHGWQSFNSSHVHLLPAEKALPAHTRLLSAADIPALCQADEAAISSQLQKSLTRKPTVSVIPDTQTIVWHHARAEFFAHELLKKDIPNKGAIVELPDGRRAWCYWQHNWTKAEADKENKLYILRLAIPEGGDEELADLIEPLLAAAQAEAAAWNLSTIELWSPSQATLLAAQRLDPEAKEMHRDTSSISSLLWLGEGSWQDVRWANNERFGWC